MNHMSEVKQTLVDAQAFLESSAMVELHRSRQVAVLACKVVGDLFTSCQVYEVEVAVFLHI